MRSVSNTSSFACKAVYISIYIVTFQVSEVLYIIVYYMTVHNLINKNSLTIYDAIDWWTGRLKNVSFKLSKQEYYITL